VMEGVQGDQAFLWCGVFLDRIRGFINIPNAVFLYFMRK